MKDIPQHSSKRLLFLCFPMRKQQFEMDSNYSSVYSGWLATLKSKNFICNTHSCASQVFLPTAYCFDLFCILITRFWHFFLLVLDDATKIWILMIIIGFQRGSIKNRLSFHMLKLICCSLIPFWLLFSHTSHIAIQWVDVKIQFSEI